MWSVKVKQIIIITYRVKLPSADRLRQRVFYLIHEITLDSGRHMIGLVVSTLDSGSRGPVRALA